MNRNAGQDERDERGRFSATADGTTCSNYSLHVVNIISGLCIFFADTDDNALLALVLRVTIWYRLWSRCYIRYTYR